MAQNEKNDRKPRENRPPAFIAFHVEEKGKNAYWTRIGAAWRHEKGDGLTLQLDLLPVSGGKVILRAPKEDGNNEGAGA
jgi:hypothetical protein